MNAGFRKSECRIPIFGKNPGFSFRFSEHYFRLSEFDFRFSEKTGLNWEDQRISLLGFRGIKWNRNNDPQSKRC